MEVALKTRQVVGEVAKKLALPMKIVGVVGNIAGMINEIKEGDGRGAVVETAKLLGKAIPIPLVDSLLGLIAGGIYDLLDAGSKERERLRLEKLQRNTERVRAKIEAEYKKDRQLVDGFTAIRLKNKKVLQDLIDGKITYAELQKQSRGIVDTFGLSKAGFQRTKKKLQRRMFKSRLGFFSKMTAFG